MADLLVKPSGISGKVHDVTPESAGWRYVGFGLYRLRAGESASEATNDRETILVLVEGKAEIAVDGHGFGELGDRMDVFERKKPWCVYVPNGGEWRATATTDCTFATLRVTGAMRPESLGRTISARKCAARAPTPVTSIQLRWRARMWPTACL